MAKQKVQYICTVSIVPPVKTSPSCYLATALAGKRDVGANFILFDKKPRDKKTWKTRRWENQRKPATVITEIEGRGDKEKHGWYYLPQFISNPSSLQPSWPQHQVDINCAVFNLPKHVYGVYNNLGSSDKWTTLRTNYNWTNCKIWHGLRVW